MVWCVSGYEKFNQMRSDPALAFLQRCGPPDGEALAREQNDDDDNDKYVVVQPVCENSQNCSASVREYSQNYTSDIFLSV